MPDPDGLSSLSHKYHFFVLAREFSAMGSRSSFFSGNFPLAL